VPSGNVDFAPTFLHLLGIAAPRSMQGRVLYEGLRVGAKQGPAQIRTMQQTAATADGAYRQTAHFSIVRSGGVDYRYLDYTVVTRSPKGPAEAR
jgi:hypothetical protein